MRIYLAGPLFSSAERTWNAELAARLEAGGHEVFLPQDRETDPLDPAGIFRIDHGGLDWSEGVVAVMDGPDPDSGTAWECGYAFGTGRPIILVRTDFRSWDVSRGGAPYNPMLTESAAVHLELPMADVDRVATAVLEALAGLD